ncbi:MAG: phage portal protein [Acetobacter sp.]|jgi:HK97 family phage portal protein|nr:phage portal protein [Acetobacter sp.]MCH4060483.1 phage portal protein [Acetobacter sp.]MCH4087423.1 phage portal protein [Acetobacter sp.]MCI1293941.1 phage portal protein [Acetobacter sp.]MCI1320465.1 phage portal protein [Acetobacter sp.]
MGFLDYLRGGRHVAPSTRQEPILGAASGPSPSDAFQAGGAWTSLSIGGISKSGVAVNERTTLSLPAVMQALRILSGVFAMVPMHYCRQDGTGKHRLVDDPLYRLMNGRPNEAQSRFLFREILFSDILMAGNFYAYVSRDAFMRPVALTRLDPLGVQPQQSFSRASGQNMFYDATLPDGTSGRFPSRDIWHVAGMGRSGLTGLNPIAYMREAFGEVIATASYVQNYWRNNGQPPVILTSDQKIAPELRRQIKDDWKSTYSGVENAGEVAVLGGGLEAKYLTSSNRDGQLVETRTMQVLDIARAWGVPPHLIFELSKATFGNIEQQSLEFVIYHLGPHFARVADAAEHAFAATGCIFIHDPSDLLKGGFLDRAQGVSALRNAGVMTTNEARNNFDLNPIGGSIGDELWRPMNTGLAGQTPEPPSGN